MRLVASLGGRVSERGRPAQHEHSDGLLAEGVSVATGPCCSPRHLTLDSRADIRGRGMCLLRCQAR